MIPTIMLARFRASLVLAFVCFRGTTVKNSPSSSLCLGLCLPQSQINGCGQRQRKKTSFNTPGLVAFLGLLMFQRRLALELFGRNVFLL